ncbi:uncharacterized protein [Mytilus edulis]|uniref:uncharacterized protein n=1 Tax=Mytilus edulis TaxID=6550 RepID=UPI0039EF234F
MVLKKSGSIQKGERKCENIKKSIEKIREEINNHLDKLEKKLWKEADTVWDQEKCKITGFITEIEEKKKILKEMQDDLHTVTEHTSKLQSFLGVHQIGEEVLHYRRYVEEIGNNDMAIEVDIKFKQIGGIEEILSTLQSLKSFGDIQVFKTEITINRETCANREAQVETQEQSHIDKMTMQVGKKIEFNINMIKKNISDMVCLSDGRIVVVEHNGAVYQLSSDVKLQKQLPIPGEARSVTQISKDTIAITYPGENTIKIFNIEDDTMTKVFKLHKYCCGLSFSNASLAVGLLRDEIRIIDLAGNTLKSIHVQSESYLKFLVYSHDRVIYSDYGGKAVYCVDGSGKKIWQYKQDLLGPEGLCTDTYGNIIVAERGSSSLIVISKDGQDSKVLVRKEEGLIYPKCICVGRNDSYGFVCDSTAQYMAKFILSYA